MIPLPRVVRLWICKPPAIVNAAGEDRFALDMNPFT